MIATVDSGALLELMWAAPAAALGLTIAMGLVVHGGTRAYEAARDGRNFVAGLHAAVAIAGGLAFAAAVVYALIIMTSK